MSSPAFLAPVILPPPAHHARSPSARPRPRPRPAFAPRAALDSPPPPLSVADSAKLWAENIMVLYGDKPARDSAPVASGDAGDLLGGAPFFVALHRYFQQNGPVYKLAFGPKVFIVLQDPVMVRQVLKEDSSLFDKGILAEVLEDIMGTGLIPADFKTWKVRRRAIAPGFHKKWLECMTAMFGDCTQRLCDKLDDAAATAGGQSWLVNDMESEYCSLALDIIGRAIFNYDFRSVNDESPIIKAVYRVLREAEHRSVCVLPYWKLPGVSALVPRQRAFSADMRLINGTLDDLITAANQAAHTADLEELENRDYNRVQDPSLLQFLVDLRGEGTTNKQLRDDLMTMLIAGHETTAALLTWVTFELAQAPHLADRAREEIDAVCGDNHPTFDDVKKLGFVRRLLAETLRLYPEPPLLIRRCLVDMEIKKGGAAQPTAIMRGTDIFINVYSLHRSPDLWEEPERFDPDRWLRPFSNPGIEEWKGYRPAEGLDSGKSLYPNEVAADFAFLPFGGGARKCVGDQFAMLESVSALAMILRRFEFELAGKPEDVGFETGATIHTKNGLKLKMRRRRQEGTTSSFAATVAEQEQVAVPSSP